MFGSENSGFLFGRGKLKAKCKKKNQDKNLMLDSDNTKHKKGTPKTKQFQKNGKDKPMIEESNLDFVVV